MSRRIYKTAGLAPIQSTGSGFATPIFRHLDDFWYQRIVQNKIDGFDELSAGVLPRVHLIDVERTREIGQLPLFAYLRDDGDVYIGEHDELATALRQEFKKNLHRPYLRHAIAKFIEDDELIKVAKTEIELLRSARLIVPMEGLGNRRPSMGNGIRTVE